MQTDPGRGPEQQPQGDRHEGHEAGAQQPPRDRAVHGVGPVDERIVPGRGMCARAHVPALVERDTQPATTQDERAHEDGHAQEW
jgi:hypothetical protein